MIVELIEWVHMFYWFFDIYLSSVEKYLPFIKSHSLEYVCSSLIFTFLFSCRISLRDAFKNSNLQVGKKSVQSLSISYLLTFEGRSDWRQFCQIFASTHQNATKSVLVLYLLKILWHFLIRETQCFKLLLMWC